MGLCEGVVDPVALAWRRAAGAGRGALCARNRQSCRARAAGHALFLPLAALLFLHLLPGFHNPLVIAPVAAERERGALWHVPEHGQASGGVLGGAGVGAADDGRQSRAQPVAAADAGAARPRCWHVWDARWRWAWWAGRPNGPTSGWLWLVNNALLVTLAEEALFRGYVQQRLSACAGSHRAWGGLGGVAVAAVLFGLAHYAGGWQWMLLAGLAGAAYGAAYKATAAWAPRYWRTWA